MPLFNSSNPAFRNDPFSRVQATGSTMTLNGTINKIGILLLLTTASAAWTWHITDTQGASAVAPWLWGGIIGGLIASLVTIFVQRAAPVTAPLYAVLEGFALGGISSFLDKAYQGIAIEAVALTFGTLFLMLTLYWTGIVRATPMFVRGVIIATGAVALLYVVSMVFNMFGHPLSFMYDSTPLSIGISLFVVALAAFNLILDFAMIEQGSREGAPKYMEWYGAFALMVTLVWLYMEILRLLAKTQRRR
ncbi:MAG TPA: Bax inhibitor-1/YccA family protein [Opitutales bacterium]|jgi:uncharacterized YccA/Bax inhibitor family protein|nr:Bax inhibitor-1/YccA family protein [Opitutales bacterium]